MMPDSLTAQHTASLRESIADNDRRLRTLLGLSSIPFVVGVVILAWISGAFILVLVGGLLVSAAILGFSWARAESMVMRSLGARRADRAGDERFRNLVEGLCVVSGSAEPDLFVLDDVAPNMAVLGRGPDRASLVVTSGLLDTMDRVELEGVLAHGLARIRDNDIGPATFAAVLGKGCVPRLADRVIAYASPRDHVARADLAAIGLTRYPPGLIGALIEIEGAIETTVRVPRTERQLWFVEARTAGASSAHPAEDGAVEGTHPPLAERIERLREL